MTDTEKAALERRIDELCAEVEKYRSARDASVDLATKTIDRIRELEAEVERLHADQAHWELGNCPSCPNIADLQEALEQNAKLRGQYEAVIDDYRSEVAKLRELCAEQLDNLMPEICAKAWWCEGKDWHTCNDDACGNYTFVILARELGVTA